MYFHRLLESLDGRAGLLEGHQPRIVVRHFMQIDRRQNVGGVLKTSVASVGFGRVIVCADCLELVLRPHESFCGRPLRHGVEGLGIDAIRFLAAQSGRTIGRFASGQCVDLHPARHDLGELVHPEGRSNAKGAKGSEQPGHRHVGDDHEAALLPFCRPLRIELERLGHGVATDARFDVRLGRRVDEGFEPGLRRIDE